MTTKNLSLVKSDEKNLSMDPIGKNPGKQHKDKNIYHI